MKKLIKVCAIAGLILTLCGFGISSLAAVAGAAVRGVGSSVFSRLEHAVRWSESRWGGNWEDRWEDRWENRWENRWEDQWDHFWEYGYWGNDDPIQHPAGQSEQAAGSQSGSAAEAQGTVAGDEGYQEFSGIRNLDVEMDWGSVRLQRGEQTENIYVKIEDPKGRARCYSEEGELKIRWERKRRVNEDVKVLILVPQDYVFAKVELDMGAAYCVAEDIATGRLEVTAGVGSVQYTGQVNEYVEVDTGVGDISLSLLGSETDYNYEIACGVGSVRVGGSNYSSLGGEHIVDNQAGRTMDLECGVGSIEINFNEAL